MYSYRIFSIRIAYSIYEYILLIPKKIPKFVAKLLKEKRNKDELDYGYGNFVEIGMEYIRDISSNTETLQLLHISLITKNNVESKFK